MCPPLSPTIYSAVYWSAGLVKSSMKMPRDIEASGGGWNISGMK